MKYADYNYYKSTYLGDLEKNIFDKNIIKASMIIDSNINQELTEDSLKVLSNSAQEKLKYTACALSDLIERKQNCDNRKITSLSIDGVSKTYTTIPDSEYEKKVSETLKFLPDELTCYL